MAGVLNALASYVTKMLTDMATNEVALLIGVSSGIKNLEAKLRDLNNFLADADRRNITDESVRGWVDELKRAMYLATDILDLCQLKVMEQVPSKGCLSPLLFCMQNPLHAHDIGTRIKALNEELDDIYNRGCSFNFINLEAYPKRKTTRPLATDREADSLMERSGAIGEKIEEDTRLLVEVLTRKAASDKTERLMVVAIVGVGGVGKTTLAKKVFSDESIKGMFNERIWLSITQDFNSIELLRKAITAANGELPGEGGAQDKELLVVALKDAIKDKKFFLLLDDMWGVDVWDKLLMTPFSYGGPGSRVLITTRDANVGRTMKALHYHHVEKLGHEDAWSLLKKQVLISEENEPEVDKLKNIGLRIIEKCDGLPLAVKVMGGLLCKKEKTRHDWEDVLNDDIWSVSRMTEELNYAIYLSYEDLPPCLKQCFLYFSLKPKKATLTVNQVASMWIGEGLIHGDSCSLEEEGKKYYKELVLRNLIEPHTDFPGEFVGNMHDVIRSFAQFVARDEALVAHCGDTAKNKFRPHNFLRFSIETKGVELDGFEWRYLIEQKSLRTLILSGKFEVQPGDSLITFSSLRTLFIESANFAALVESVCQLKHLRYLSLKSCTDISRLPENIHEMKFLQHINLEGCEGIVELPDSIVKLRELRYLDTGNTHINSIPRGFGALTNLRVLCGFPTYMVGDWCSLEELGPLSQLMELGLKVLETVSATSSIARARVHEKRHLTKLALEGDYGLVFDEQRIKEMFDELCPPLCLEFLSIERYFGRQLPRWMMWTAAEDISVPLENLRTLWMEDLTCCTQLPDGLCQLPCLEYMSLVRAPAIKHVGPEFVQPRRSSSQAVAAAAFPRLQKLTLNTMLEWEQWVWEEAVDAMPVLEDFFIQSCKLRCIPPGLATHARALKKLTIWSVQCLQFVENFDSVVELRLHNNQDLTRISNFPKLQKLEIDRCQKLESLQGMKALRRLVLSINCSVKRLHRSEIQLPKYLKTVEPTHLLLNCSSWILASMAAGKSGSEWEKFSHIQHVEAYANGEGTDQRWHLFYTREPCSIKTTIVPQKEKGVVTN